MIYFIGDLHFGDENIIKFDNRPFNTVEEMDKELIKRWNAAVTVDDDIYINGDIGNINSDTLSQLNGNKYLIMGNHDELLPYGYIEMGFVNAYDHPIILEDFYIISHEPMYVNNNSPYANIFAHIHNNPMYKGVSTRSFCTSACRSKVNYSPVSFQYIKNCISVECEKEASNDRS